MKARSNDTPWAKSNFLFEDNNGTVWGGVYGLCKLEPDKQRFTRYRIEPNENRHVRSLYEDENGRLWCGTSDGLHQFDVQQEQFVAHYYEQDGLPSNHILKIIDDDSGKLWLLTTNGLCVFDRDASPDQRFKVRGQNEGITNTPHTYSAFIKSRSGEIYWGGGNGIYRFFPGVTNSNSNVPPVRLTDFKLFNQSVKLDTSTSEIKTIRLAHDQNFFAFEFAALDFTNPIQNHYAYKLEGLDEDWVQTGYKREANYTHVPPGKYTFRVKGSNNDGVWNEQGASVNIIIAPPFWATWWFRSAVVLAAAGILFALYRYRVNRLLELQLTRLRIAQDLHDDIGSSLSSIALESELVQGRTALDEKERTRLRRIANRSRQLIESMDDIVWAINPTNDRLDHLLLRMKETAADLLSKQGIHHTIRFPKEDLPHSLEMEFRRNLFLIFKELLNNIFKHAQASHVEIDLAKKNGVLILKVKDDGVGFDPSAANNGNGLLNMKMRAMKLNGRIDFQHPAAGGVKATLTVKIP